MARMNFSTKLLDEPARSRVNNRRMTWPKEDMPLVTLARFPPGNSRKVLLDWIDRHTTSNFYMGGNQIGFEDERDELVFRLKFNVK